MSGNFYYKHVERKSFDLQQEDYEIEVYYERLPKKTQAAILSQKNFSKTPVTVKGVLKRFSNAKNSYYIMATNVQGLAIEKKTGGGLHYTDILLSPEKYVGKEVTMSGNFYYKHVERKSFDLQQEDYEIEVYYERLPKKTQAAILSQRIFLKLP
jgi:hypothetical protein